jgi:type I restriction-modification system DNA methylase subunit
MKEALREVSDLVERFERNIEAYHSPAYNETQLRREFIDPFFEALGWDVANKAGYAEQYKDVVHEDAIKIAGATKAPDYCFRIGGVRKFFLETKKPSIDIKDQVSPAYQLRRYAWSAKLSLSILTDFEEMAVYDCRFRPKPSDKPSIGRVRIYNYTQYLNSFEEIYSLFSKESVLKGSFDKFAESERLKRGTAEVDAEFLKEIESWREALAKEIAIRNPKLSVHELNFAVQLTIDRIIFLRMCEDRGIEKYGQIQSLLNGTNTYHRLREIFYHADDKYNSGLFDFKTDRLTPELTLDDKPLKEIFRNLYYPESPYEFSVIGADILGHVYEQFLGKVIRLTEGHRAKVEEKPEVRKAGGVYYTPTYIVDYIVKNTVGKLCEGKTPKQISSLRILDPACGSGSFLLGAYQYLLDYHRDWYQKDGPTKHTKEIYQGYGGQWHLTTQEKKRILLNNIYGVDIDPQAVEVTKLSLLLKVMEGENQDTLERQLKLFKERALPDLGSNIKCGNSLIGPDFYSVGAGGDLPSLSVGVGHLPPTLNEEEIYRINAFDWKKEFPEIMKAGGFDAVIGNPPYGAEFEQIASEHLKNKFQTFVWRGESYLVFVEKGVQLLKLRGLLGYIIPDTYLNLGFTQSLRTLLLQHSKLHEIVNLPSSVFSGGTVDTTLLFVEKATETSNFHEANVLVKIFDKKSSIRSVNQPSREFTISTRVWFEQNAFNIHSDIAESKIISKIESGNKPLSHIGEIFYGIKAYQVGKGKPPQTEDILEKKPFTSFRKEDKAFLPFFDGKHVGRYELLWDNNNWLKYGPWLAEPRQPQKYEGEKILIRKIVGKTLIATYVPDTSYCNTLLFVLKIKSDINVSYYYLLGILNSKFIGWFFRKKFQISADDTFPQIMIRDILRFPIPSPVNTSPDRMVELVERMLSLHKQLAVAKTPDNKIRLQRQIDATDHQIDHLVYELYELTEEEIKIVEEKLQRP